MGTFKPEDIRNIALLGHGNCGKTTLAESFLTVSGAISRAGKVDDGTAKTDYDQEEISRKISINTVPATFEWDSKEFTVLDTPGFFDFLPEVKVVLTAVDGAILVVDGVSGCEAGTEKTYSMSRERNMPTIVFINKMEKENADYDKALASIKEELDGTFAPFVIPIGAGPEFTGVVDIVHKKAYQWDSTTGDMKEIPIAGDIESKVDDYREALIEAAADADDAIAEKYLGGEEITDEELQKTLRNGVLKGVLSPVLCGSALGHAGTQRLIELAFDYLPSPADSKRSASKGEENVELSVDDEFAGQVFKTLVEQHLGELALIRVVSGTVKNGDTAYNSTRESKEKIGQMFKLRGKERVETEQLTAGEIGALVKLKITKTGDTLCSENSKVKFAELEYPEPLIAISVTPATKADQEKLSTSLSKLTEEDPAVRMRYEVATHQTLIEGNGEVQLDILIKRLNSRFKVNVNTEQPKVAYKETIRGKAEAQGRHKKQTGGRGQFGDVWLRFEPLEPGAGFEFVDAIVGGVVPGRFVPAVLKGLNEAQTSGVLAGYPVTDFKVTLYDGSYHPVDSSEIAFKTAAHLAFKKGMPQAKPVLLEPIMEVKVTVPEQFMGDIMGDLNTRRAKILGMDPIKKKQVIRAHVPLAEMDRYIVNLRSMTEGRGEYTMKFVQYEEVPQAVTQQVIEKARKEREAASD